MPMACDLQVDYDPRHPHRTRLPEGAKVCVIERAHVPRPGSAVVVDGRKEEVLGTGRFFVVNKYQVALVFDTRPEAAPTTE